MDVRQGLFFSERKKLSASNWHKDVVRRAARFRVDSYPSLVVNLDEAPFDRLTALSNVEGLRPPLLRVMQNVWHCILSPLKKGSVPDINISAFINMVAYMLRSLSLRKFSVSLTLSIISRSCGNSAPGFFISYY